MVIGYWRIFAPKITNFIFGGERKMKKIAVVAVGGNSLITDKTKTSMYDQMEAVISPTWLSSVGPWS